jgi:hypothetical protein
LVRTAFPAATERARRPRRRAAERAWPASDAFEAAECPSRRSARRTARDRAGEAFFLPDRPRFRASFALRRVFAEAFPFRGARSFTPALRAFERPIAIACWGDRTPCFPSRTWCISSRTNSPACVDGAFPSSLSSFARSTVAFSGIMSLTSPG